MKSLINMISDYVCNRIVDTLSIQDNIEYIMVSAKEDIPDLSYKPIYVVDDELYGVYFLSEQYQMTTKVIPVSGVCDIARRIRNGADPYDEIFNNAHSENILGAFYRDVERE